MNGCWLLVVGIWLSVGCYYITNNQIPTTYNPKLFLCFFILIFYFLNNKTTKQPDNHYSILILKAPAAMPSLLYMVQRGNSSCA